MNEEAKVQDQFRNLHPEVREELSKWDGEDVALFREMRTAFKNGKTIGRFFKWLIITILGVFLGTIMFWEGVLKVAKWFGRAP